MVPLFGIAELVRTLLIVHFQFDCSEKLDSSTNREMGV